MTQQLCSKWAFSTLAEWELVTEPSTWGQDSAQAGPKQQAIPDSNPARKENYHHLLWRHVYTYTLGLHITSHDRTEGCGKCLN